MANMTDPKTLAKLATIGFRKMEDFRKNRLKMLAQYSSRFYGRTQESGARVESRTNPINLIYQAVTTLVPNLVYKNPCADVTSRFVAYKGYAEILKLAVNHLIEEIRFSETLRMVITNSIFMAGFWKIGLGVSSQTLDIDGIGHDIGQPYCDNVDPDDMLLDPLARSWDEQRFMGNRFRVDKNVLIDSGLYNADDISQLASRYQYGDNEASVLSSTKGRMTEADTLMETIDLIEVYLPGDKLVVTLPWQPGNVATEKFLRVVEYEGPERGPYGMLGYAFVPDNILPVAPAMIWYDLHIMANKLARKLVRQAERQKTVLAYESSAWQDAQEVVDADDGETVRVDNIDAIKEVSYGGAEDDGYKYVDWARQQFSEMAMNIDLMSGMGSNEPTATQAEMVQTNSTIRLADMQGQVYSFAGEGLKSLAFLLHTDPLIELPLVKRSGNMEQQVFYTPEMREGGWLDYNIKVKPYSMARQDPNLKVRRLMELCGNVIPALANAFQMLGPAFNLENTLILIGKEMGIDELPDIINSAVLQQQVSNLMQLLEQGVPLDQKVIQSMMGSGVMGGAMAGPVPSANTPPGGVRPQQPNPYAGLRASITPETEMNQGRQVTAADLQAQL